MTNEWKTEIMHRSRTMYDRTHALCASQPPSDSKCDHCGNRTPATALVCERHENKLRYEKRYKELQRLPSDSLTVTNGKYYSSK